MILHSHQQCMRIPNSPPPHQHSLFFHFVKMSWLYVRLLPPSQLPWPTDPLGSEAERLSQVFWLQRNTQTLLGVRSTNKNKDPYYNLELYCSLFIILTIICLVFKKLWNCPENSETKTILRELLLAKFMTLTSLEPRAVHHFHFEFSTPVPC